MIGFQYTPYTLPLMLAAITAGILAFFMWQRRPGPGVIPFVVLMSGVVLWSLFYAIELSITNVDAKFVLTIIEYVGITSIPASWLAFALEYTGREKWLTRRNVALLTIQPALVILITSTNNLHHFFWASQRLNAMAGFSMLVFSPNIGFWIHAVYSYLLILAGTLLIIQALIRSPGVYRGQTVTLLIAAFAPWIANFLFLSNLSPFQGLDVTPFAFTITGLMLGWSMVRFRLLDIAPIARDRVFESMQDGVMVLDVQRRIVDVNPAALRLIGKSTATEVIGKTTDEVAMSMSALIAQYRNVEEANTEISITTGTQPRHFQLAISPLRNQRGDLTGRLFVVHEISELKQAADQIRIKNEALEKTNRDLERAQQEAEEANRLKSEFLATMSHELRTPLNAIIGFTDLMLTGLPGTLNDKQRDYVQRVISNGERLLGLINDILDLAKIEAARLDVVNVPFSPGNLLKGIDSQLHSLADQKGLRFETALDPQLQFDVMGDPHRLEQILVNLIGNAIRFTDSGAVTVNFNKTGPTQWVLIVSDTGVGIPPHALEFIFDEFRQVDGSARRKYGGTGLGLAIVRKLAILMGGTVRVQSELGKGSTFTVELPLILAEMPIVEKGN